MVTDAAIFASEAIKLEPDAVRQLCDAASLPPAKKVLATADIHVGFGIPIGAVLGLDNAIMPAAVGYDINCGMRLLRTPFTRGDIDTDKIAMSIARDIPLGEGRANLPLDKAGIEAVINNGAASISSLAGRIKHPAWEAFDPAEFAEDLKRIEENGRMPADLATVPRAAIQKGSGQLGTLGGGNHFIEIQYVQKVVDPGLARNLDLFENQIVVMIHSGSRRFGYEVADEYMNIAARRPDMAERSKMLSYLPTDSEAGRNYITAMGAAANFAFTNRHVIVFSRIGQPMITPGSMGTASFLMVGTGDSEESLCSVNHGAGRVMSRTAALGKTRRGRIITPARISDEKFKRSMEGIKLIAGNRSKIKEEAPDAYKDIDEVVRIVVECGWARVVARMVPLAVLKG